MNISKDGISKQNISNHALQATVAILMIGVPVSLVLGGIISSLIKDAGIVSTLIGLFVGIGVTCYIFLQKVFLALAIDVTDKGVEKEVYDSVKK